MSSLSQATNNFQEFAAYPTMNIEQQTFLGASVRSFSANGGFGDTSSTLSIDLIVDEYNSGDGPALGMGKGQDVYHNGKYDEFKPPPAGSPVFFTMGSTRQTVQDVFKRAYDQYYSNPLLTPAVQPTSPFYNHFSFGGILQTYVQTRGPGGNPFFSAQIVDPREILSNVQVILNNYGGSTFRKDNILNVYGFLECNTSKTKDQRKHPKAISVLNQDFTEIKFDKTYTNYRGVDALGFLYQIQDLGSQASFDNILKFRFNNINPNTTTHLGTEGRVVEVFTGTGFSRRSERGIPYYRVVHAINSLFGHYGGLEPEHDRAGFFNSVNFRGVKYAIDLSDLPVLAPFHYLEYDQINLLDLIMEICDTLNHDVFVTLLPIVDHKGCKRQFNLKDDPNHKYEAVIKVIAIDRSTPFNLSAIKTYIDNLNVDEMKSNDVGYELANNVTDKIVVGANEVENFYFRSDLDKVYKDDSAAAWHPDVNLSWSVLPYYGTLANKGVTIPVGRGAYQQILLDTTSLFAYGVGNFYVATELELRAALMSFESWRDFLLMYDNIYMEPVSGGDIKGFAEGDGEYKVTVPRCAIPPITAEEGFDENGSPQNSCHPPYGYPLYWKRAGAIGMPQAGLMSSASFNKRIVEITSELKNASRDGKGSTNLHDAAIQQLGEIDRSRLTTEEKAFYDELHDAIKNGEDTAFIDESRLQAMSIVSASKQQTKANMENVMRVYNFVRSVASECLGKKFLVGLPQQCNDNWHPSKTPFGFPTRQLSENPNSLTVFGVEEEVPEGVEVGVGEDGKIHYGALKVNKNVIANKYEFNYTPEPLGGYPSDVLWDGLEDAGLFPEDATAIFGENGRVKPYVIFDHSEELDFSKVNKEDYIQQRNGLDPNGKLIKKVDYAHTFENSSSASSDINGTSILNAPSSDGLSKGANKEPTRAFMTCSIDAKLYMPPKFIKGTKPYYGQKQSKSIKRKPMTFVDTDANPPKETSVKPSDEIHYSPNSSTAGSLEITYIDLNYLFDDESGKYKSPVPSFKYDTDIVYALITLPSRIQSTVTSRYRTCQEHSKGDLYHQLLADVTPIFTAPAGGAAGNMKTLKWGVSEKTFSENGFDKAVEKTYSNLMFSHPNRISVMSGSPVVPDFISIPLMSRERCYGPWMSSYGKAVGGNVEFEKDESLAPWNYAGFKFMDSTGKIKASFGSSAQFTSERGSFTLASGPTGGLVLGKSLASAGPLVTTINMDISSAGISTVYKMDLFTSSFGKMQKQKEGHIAKMSRNQQKLTDEKNSLERKNMGKQSTSDTMIEVNKRMRQQARDAGSAAAASAAAPSADSAPNQIVVSTNRNQEGRVGISSSMLSNEQMAAGGENMASSAENSSRQYYNSVAVTTEDLQVPASMEPSHPNMSSRPVVNVKGNAKYYEKSDGYTIAQITYWRT